MIGHHFTVDVEEYFQVSAFESIVRRDTWESFESRVDAPMNLLLEMLEETDSRGTFFVLGWLAQRRPHLVRRIAELGHEVASHGMDHRRVLCCTEAEFRTSLRDSKALLEDLCGAEVLGFRAPSFSIVRGCEWAFDALLETGYSYDSSVFPIRRRGYGYAGAPRAPFFVNRPSGRLAEFPPATLKLGPLVVPAGGGAYFRLFPAAMATAALEGCEADRAPGTFYIHPWELDPAQPRLTSAPLTRVRHYGGLGHTAARLRRLLARFRFTRTMKDSAAMMFAASDPAALA